MVSSVKFCILRCNNCYFIEEIIKRRLMFDGDGTGDERKINLFQKVLSSWVASKNMSKEENLRILNKCFCLLRNIEYSWMKSKLVQKCCQEELDMYKKFQKRTEKNIERIRETIDQSKIVLQDVQKEKQHKLNYNMIAEEIASVPSRKETMNVVNKLNEELSELEKEKLKLDADWERWRQHFKVIATSANNLQDMLDEK